VSLNVIAERDKIMKKGENNDRAIPAKIAEDDSTICNRFAALFDKALLCEIALRDDLR